MHVQQHALDARRQGRALHVSQEHVVFGGYVSDLGTLLHGMGRSQFPDEVQLALRERSVRNTRSRTGNDE